MKIKLAIAFLLCNTGFILSAAVNWPFQLCFVTVVTAGLLWYLDGKVKNYVPFLMMAPAFLFYSCYVIYYQLSHVYPIVVFPIVIAFIYLLLKRLNKKHYKMSMIVLLLFSTFPVYFLMSWWLAYLDKTPFESEVNASFANIELYSMDDQLINLKDKGDTLIVLDFWSTSCGICFKEFPEFNYNAGNPKVQFYAVNMPLRKDTLSKTKAIISTYFPDSRVLFIKDANAFKTLNIDGVPMYYLIRNNTILFKGHIEIGKGWKESLASKIAVS